MSKKQKKLDPKLVEKVFRALGIDYDYLLKQRNSLIPYSKNDGLAMLKEKLVEKDGVDAFYTRWVEDLLDSTGARWEAILTVEGADTAMGYADTEFKVLLIACYEAFCKNKERK